MESHKTRVACLQMSSTDSSESNWNTFEKLTREAVSNGAQWVLSPENTFYLGAQFHKVSTAQALNGEWVNRCSILARDLQVYLFIGSIAEIHMFDDGTTDQNRCYNTSIVISPNGNLESVYRKVHLFDVDIPGGLTIFESDKVIPGNDLSITEIGNFKVGLSICYDLRFGEMYRKLVESGCNVLIVPSAFTNHTGVAHWHALLRARAIENQCWVLAPAQTGIHDTEGKRHSYGHSLIIDPWGTIIQDAGTEEGYIIADIDAQKVTDVRQSIPVSHHRVF